LSNHQTKLKNIIADLKLDYEDLLYSGVNSKVHILRNDSEKFILKIFNHMNKNSNLRLQREVSALSFLNINSIENIPKLISHSFEKSFILTSFLNGKKIKSFSKSYIPQIIDFNLSLRKSNFLSNSLKIEDASESFLQMYKFLNTLDLKFKSINKNISNSKICEVSINDFLKYLYSDFKDYFRIYCKDSNFKEYLINEKQIFSQSDVGIHNCLDNNNKLLFFDFEHSGWDDPAKQLADWILRPNSNIKNIDSLNLLICFCENWHDKDLHTRIKRILPLINIKWILIRLAIGFSNKVENKNDYLNPEMNLELYYEGKSKIDFISDNFS
tara:strand:+ start:1911 stop:2891 length:981 start_codon:yes stop_codon:yes gene_type:complete